MRLLRDNIEERAWHAEGWPAEPLSAITIGVTSWWLRRIFAIINFPLRFKQKFKDTIFQNKAT